MRGRAEYLCYTDGSCKAGDSAPGGWGFFIKPPSGEAMSGYGKATGTLAKIMEYQAVAEALAVLPIDACVTVLCDNESLVLNLDRHLAEWSTNGFANVDPLILTSVRRIAATIAEKGLVVKFQWVRAHSGNAGNERADALAAQGAREAKTDLHAAQRPIRRGRTRRP